MTATSNEKVIIDLPLEVRITLDRLHAAGYEAYIVGGCVRDSLRQTHPADWDITTSARPEEIKTVFKNYHVIETGIQHGTVTVLIYGKPLEITTYRVDGTYSDGRHPDSVRFTPNLTEDLARRDFTINALAYCEQDGIIDRFRGQRDLADHLIRCVGVPEERFSEDALRILRALRFSSVLDFQICPDVRRAILARKDTLSWVSPERIRVEFCKLLCGCGAVRILKEYADVFRVFLSALTDLIDFDQKKQCHFFDQTLCALEHCPSDDLLTRLVLLLQYIGIPASSLEDETVFPPTSYVAHSVQLADTVFRALRFDNATRERTCLLLSLTNMPLLAERPLIKRLLQKVSPEDIRRLYTIRICNWQAGMADCSPDENFLSTMDTIISEGACYTLKTLAIHGKELQAMGVGHGKEIGALLTMLLDEVIDEKLSNTLPALSERAKQLMKTIE